MEIKNKTQLMVVDQEVVKSMADTLVAMKMQITQLEEMLNKLNSDFRKVRLSGLK